MFKQLLAFVLTAALLSTIEGTADEDKISNKKISPTLQTTTTEANVIVSFDPDTRSIIRAISTRQFATRGDRITEMVNNLKANADKSQQAIREVLASDGIDFQVMWLTNQLYIKNTNATLREELAKNDQVTEIVENESIRLDDPPEPITTKDGRQLDVLQWGVERVRAEEARELLMMPGVNPAEIRVGTVDTGVRHTHEALRDNFLGTYGWYDPHAQLDTPEDLNGHGTHVTGIVCGKGGIGVFPEAKWMHCRACYDQFCDRAALILCGQFMVCPTLTNLSNPDCTQAPHVVSNSWGGGRGLDWYDVTIEVYHAAGIIPLFSAGNSGPLCDTVSSPGDRDVISVGSTATTEMISSFSSRGPSIDRKMKPDVVAPGQAILSAYHLSDTTYATISGTSMASPHAAGVVAILLAYNPNLTYDQVKDVLQSKADTAKLVPSGQECGGVLDSEIPSHTFGHGRVNAMRSLSELMAMQFDTPPPQQTTTRDPDLNNAGSRFESGVTLISVVFVQILYYFL